MVQSIDTHFHDRIVEAFTYLWQGDVFDFFMAMYLNHHSFPTRFPAEVIERVGNRESDLLFLPQNWKSQLREFITISREFGVETSDIQSHLNMVLDGAEAVREHWQNLLLLIYVNMVAEDKEGVRNYTNVLFRGAGVAVEREIVLNAMKSTLNGIRLLDVERESNGEVDAKQFELFGHRYQAYTGDLFADSAFRQNPMNN